MLVNNIKVTQIIQIMVEPAIFDKQKADDCSNTVVDVSSSASIPPPPSPPLLLRQNATWDEESRIREENRIREVIKAIKQQKMLTKL